MGLEAGSKSACWWFRPKFHSPCITNKAQLRYLRRC